MTPSEKQILDESLKRQHERYDPGEKMITVTLNGYNYSTDAESGVFHATRESFSYAVMLLDLGDEQYTQRAFDIINRTISLQDQDPTSRSCGVWPYYLEEPLATKKSPIDYNWADFCAVSLLDVWIGHQSRIPENLKEKIRNSLILAAKSIQKRNVGPGYTNIAIMGTYVTYMVSHLFDLPEMKEYAQNRMKKFYDYTLDKGGFTEYNSPTYTIVALDELYRMKVHIIEPSAKQMIDSLYSMGWEMIARHYHKPTGQWAGPHSRSYSSLVSPTFYQLLEEASNGRIDLGGVKPSRGDVKIKHRIPDNLMHYFLIPEYPRTEIDVFEKEEPQVIGTCYMTDKYALSSANRSSLWNQRRPFLAYWGSLGSHRYLQLQFLHDNYDFSSAALFTNQKGSCVLGGINLYLLGGDKHIGIDQIKDGRFKAKDLRIRFKFGGTVSQVKLTIPDVQNAPFQFTLDGLIFNIQLFKSVWDNNLICHWEKGGNGKDSWIDYVLYSGDEKEFDLNTVQEAAWGFTFSIGTTVISEPVFTIQDHVLKASWNDLNINMPTNLLPLGAYPKNL